MPSSDQNLIHESSLELLAKCGVAFHSPPALEVFKSRGFRLDGNLVFFGEAQVQKALDSAPSSFELHARNPAHNLTLGDSKDVALVPGYGAPFIVDAQGERRKATLADYVDFCKLVQTSQVVNCCGFMMGDPSELDPETYHLDMLLANLIHSDKPFMGSPLSAQASKDALDMAKIALGTVDEPVMVSNINSLAPLQFAGEMAEALMVLCEHNQPVVIVGGGTMGSTTPIRLAGMLAVQNAAVLAGLVLSQLMRPGTPALYGTAGSPMDMRSGAYYIGGPETNLVIAQGIGMAKFYGLPCRGGGSLCDAHELDFQAGYQSALALKTALDTGADFVLHACGILGSFMAMSPSKFLADEEVCQQALKFRNPPQISRENLDLDTIMQIGPGGQYLTHRSTFELCRSELLDLPLANRLPFDQWAAKPDKDYNARALALLQRRLEAYERPAMEPGLLAELQAFVDRAKQNRG